MFLQPLARSVISVISPRGPMRNGGPQYPVPLLVYVGTPHNVAKPPMTGVFCLGISTLDYVYSVETLPTRGEKYRSRDLAVVGFVAGV